jgi:YidC/Oxa1 family membrane protein insertase
MNDQNQNKNLLLATGLSLLVMLVWFWLFPVEPPPETIAEPVPASDATQTAATPLAADGTTATASAAAPEPAFQAPRIAIETPRLKGNLSLLGGRIDDLELSTYKETLDADSPLVRLLSPVGTDAPYYALYGWSAAAGVATDAVPGPNTVWSVESGDKLTPETPITLVWDNGAGLIFRRVISVDDRYLFSINQTVENTGNTEVGLAAYGLVARHGHPDVRKFFIAHEGLVQMTDGTLTEVAYANMEDLDADVASGGTAEKQSVTENGWIGWADKYWMTTLIPEPGTPFTSTARYIEKTAIYQTETVTPVMTVAPGATISAKSYLFAGAKEWETLRDYERSAGIQKLVESIDWGWFFFFTKPIFWLLHQIHALIGNMGWSIMALTLTLKILVLPLAYKSSVSMARMKELQPEMEKLKERVGEDKQALQQGMMKLYKDNKVNPASGCVPILIQVPIFFSLYKVIFNTIELRQAPWIGWIRDLSLPDPSSILNLFGLLPFAPPDQTSIFFILSLGVLPIILGISMWLQQTLNPAPTDPAQKMIFAWMPWVFMFMLGSFASGLVLYWITNNTITFIQQYAIMRSHGHNPDVFGNIRSKFSRTKAVEAANSTSKPSKK